MVVNFQTRLVVFFMALLASVQVITFIAVYTVTQRNVVSQITDQLRYASKVFDRRIKEHSKILSDEAQILAADFGFKRAIASNDQPTVLSALGNLKTRINADRVMLIALDSMIITDTQTAETISEPFPYPVMLETGEEHGVAASIVMIDDHIHEFVIVPVLAPEPIAWVGIGFTIDDELAIDLKSRSPLTLDISFASQQTTGQWHTQASTLSPAQQQFLPAMLSDATANGHDTRQMLFDDEEYVTLSQTLTSNITNQNVVAVLQYSMKTALGPYRHLLFWLTLLMAAGLLLSVFGGILIARSVTRPVRTLANAARRIQQGNYLEPVTVMATDEIGGLANAFNHMMTDIAERESQISYQAKHDTLTGLPNRMQFEKWLEESITQTGEHQRRFVVVLVGIKRFTEINCTLGHDVGDRLIKEVGNLIGDTIKQSDTAARLNSDVFCLLLHDATEVASPAIAKRILQIFDQPINIDDATIDISASIGIACYPVHATDGPGLMQRADAAMYIARQSEYNYAIYDPDKDPYSADQLSLMGELRAGMQNNELELYYQPQIDVARGKMTHVEALIRWNHPKRGFMSPDLFLPLAEQTGDIRKLTSWVLDNAIRQCGEWRKTGLNINVAINLSAKDLLNKDLAIIIARLLQQHEVSSAWIVLEITESAIMHDAERALDMLLVLSGMGLGLSIDDFGTGYSSMEYLKKLPVTELKIDRSFVRELAENKEDQILVKSAIDLGHNLGMTIVAEGVEDESCLAVLKAQGCDLAQGYLFSPPLPVEKLGAWISTSPWGS